MCLPSFLSFYLRLACIFLAGKIEENFIKMNDLQLITKFTDDQILETEKYLLDVILFVSLFNLHYSVSSYFFIVPSI
jgi:hypothetical protein